MVDVIPKDRNLYYICYFFGVIKKDKFSLLHHESAKYLYLLAKRRGRAITFENYEQYCVFMKIWF